MRQGSCLCESVRYQVDGNVKAVVNCHCQFCRKAHSSEFVALLITSTSNFRITFGTKLVEKYYVKNLNTHRCFCSKCGTRLYNDIQDRGLVSVAVATLDAGEAITPIAHVNTESKNSEFEIADKLPQFLSEPTLEEFGELVT